MGSRRLKIVQIEKDKFTCFETIPARKEREHLQLEKEQNSGQAKKGRFRA